LKIITVIVNIFLKYITILLTNVLTYKIRFAVTNDILADTIIILWNSN